VRRAAQLPLERALSETATAISTHPLLRQLADSEPATVARLARVDPRTPAWATARDAVTEALGRAGYGGVGVVLRWLASYVVTPAPADAIADEVRIVVAGLPVANEPAPREQAHSA
jgi:hypothetical protein